MKFPPPTTRKPICPCCTGRVRATPGEPGSDTDQAIFTVLAEVQSRKLQ